MAAVSTLRPTWSTPAAMRAVRATIVMPGLFAFSSYVLHNPQIATFAAFGSFATLVMAGFGGARRDKLIAHAELTVVGSVLLVIGTAVCSSTVLAAVAALVVAFFVIFASISGPNAASGATAALLAFVLPAASPGTISMIPDRLAGWWLASVVGTIAVLTLAPRPMANRLRVTASVLADALADQLDAALAGSPSPDRAGAAMTARNNLLSAFTAAPYRPTGLAISDQGLAALVEDLQWCATVVAEALREGSDLPSVDQVDRRLFVASTGVLRDTGRLLGGADVVPVLGQLDELGNASAARITALGNDTANIEEAVHVSFHAQMVAAAARSAASNALVAARRTGRTRLLAARARWQGATEVPIAAGARPGLLSAARRLVTGHASLRSVWFLNAARGAVALAAAIAVAKLTNVQHGFWVVLGALSVLRTSAAATGATALRALGGTALGFFIGAVLILGIGSHPVALWVALPLAVMVAAYAPGTTPFVIGQAAFTLAISVLYNIVVPVGWKVGALRLEDVAMGAAVSAAVGILFWPRGASAIVGDDLADAFHRGGVYLVQATTWALGVREARPDASARAAQASIRLDDALRGLLAEQGTKRVPKEQLWKLVGGAMRLRLSAQSLSGGPTPRPEPAPGHRALVEAAVGVAGECDGLAGQLGHISATVAQELVGLPVDDAPPVAIHGHSLWVREHLEHVKRNLAELEVPAAVVAQSRAVPWWR
jgi:uncharacterized membrane protein YccC